MSGPAGRPVVDKTGLTGIYDMHLDMGEPDSPLDRLQYRDSRSYIRTRRIRTPKRCAGSNGMTVVAGCCREPERHPLV
ncbi:DUF3738 domain-containing protein [Terriglobus sp. 2YAB30_2]|uniref:DUF3738 domain-containing protein n=1 Tax=unclassified Terriglobus TaxID=2628988 RepID=UPI003F950842